MKSQNNRAESMNQTEESKQGILQKRRTEMMKIAQRFKSIFPQLFYSYF